MQLYVLFFLDAFYMISAVNIVCIPKQHDLVFSVMQMQCDAGTQF